MSVKIRGLRELASAFRRTDAELPKKMKEAFLGIAASVAGKAAAKVPYKTGTAAGSIKPRATAKGAAIAFGGTKAPYMPWLDFGGAVGRNKSIHRAFIKEGRYIYPTISEEKQEIKEAVDQAIRTVAEAAGFDTRGEI